MSFDVTLKTVTVAYGETANIPFEGILLRTAGIMGTVTVEGVGPISDVLVTIQGQGENESKSTNSAGEYSFEQLPAGDYSVTISGFDDDEYGFAATTATVTVALRETETVAFDGIMLRTAGISGEVTVGDDDAPLSGVTVTVSGGPRDEEHPATTDSDGTYLVENLHAGDYSVVISGYDTREYGFDPTTETVSVGLRETLEVAFQGTLLRTAGVSGRVSVDNAGMAGVMVTLTGEEDREMDTNADGQFGFTGLAAGGYTLTISGYDAVEYAFEPTRDLTLALDQSSIENFTGRSLRTAGVMGYVTVEGEGLAGVSVTLVKVVSTNSGEILGAMPTGADGGYAFGLLLAGVYRVDIAGYDDEYDFAAGTTWTGPVATDETAMASFAATIIRTASVSGMVTVDGEAMADVEVTLSGGKDDSMMTGADGTYEFDGLRKGDYTVTMTNPDDNAYSFPAVAQSVNLSVGQAQSGVSFAGARLRQASISGQVAVAGTPIPGVTVMLSGDESGEDMTDANGEYSFTRLAAGDYTLTISGYDAVEYAFEPTRDLTLAPAESSIQNFTGRSLRTAGVMGYVTVEGEGLAGVAVTLIKVVSANSGEILGAKPTGADGDYAFEDLLAGVYRVDISGYDDEHDFAAGTTWTGPVATDSTANASFIATIIRTAGVSGMVTIDGEAMADVEVTLSGDHAPDDNSRMTGDDGMYSFGGLRKGDYTVTMTNPDEDAYSFPAVAQPVNLSVGQEQNGVSFAGARLRRASISGQVHAGGDPVPGVTVTLSGDKDAEDMTDANGEYNFPGLAGGTYMVTISGWNEAAYEFDSPATEKTIGNDEFTIVDFAGTHTRTAKIGGMLFLDEVTRDLMHTDGEPVLDLDAVLPEDMSGLPVTLLGPDFTSAPQTGFASREGMYEFDSLQAGSYVISISVDAEMDAAGTTVEDLLAGLGYKYTGPGLIQVALEAAEEDTDNNLPFMITMQTINVGAVMGTPEMATETMVEGVKLAMYPTVEDADNSTNMLGSGTTGENGVAKFDFAREDDDGPGGQGNDHLVFVKVTGTGHADLVVSDNAHIEIEYEATDRASMAPTAVRLLNQGVNFQWRIKSNETAKDGNEFLAGWKVVMGMDTIATGADGKGSYSGTAALGATPDTYTIMADTTQADTLTMGEEWVQSDALVHTHDPLKLPAMNTAAINDLGTIYVTYTTQRLTLGVYREADDVEGYTDYRSALPRGDHRPASGVAREMTIELRARDSNDRLQRYTWDPHPMTGEDRKEGYSAVGADGMVTFTGIPADAELTVGFHVGSSDRMQVDYGYDEIKVFGDDLNIGPTLGAFGDMSGGQPDVRICSASDAARDDATSDDWCATFGYQWMTGKVSGTVGTQSGHEVVIEAETGHGATGDDKKTGTDGAYSFTGLQDGEYSATASDAGDYTVNGAPTQEGLVVYHDEYEDDKDTLTTYVGTSGAATASWTTKQGGLSIMGYVGNDLVDAVGDRDQVFRGDEAIEGVKLQLMTGVRRSFTTGQYFGGRVVATTTTNARGLYSFEDLQAGSYQVRAVSAGTYWAVRSFGRNYNYSGPVSADEYPTPGSGNFAEGDHALPAWVYYDNVSTNNSIRVTDDKGTTATTDDVSANLVNFALVWGDGSVSGRVNNLGGSNGNIDMRVYQCLDFDADDFCGRGNPIGYRGPIELTTGSNGSYSVGGLTEGTYSIVIEDAGWSSPRVDASGMPDDDASVDNDGDGEPDVAPQEHEGTFEGRQGSISVPMFHVYDGNTTLANDNLGASSVRGYMHGTDGTTTYNDTTGWVTTGLARDDQANPEETDNLVDPLITITWASETFRTGLARGAVPLGADFDIKNGTLDCATSACKVGSNRTVTGTARPIGAHTDSITMTVTAANGYDDHRYRFSVARANPQDNGLEMVAIMGSGDAITGDGTNTSPWIATTASASAGSVNLHINIKHWGTLVARNATCAQTLAVKKGNGDDLTAGADDRDDVCEDENYRFAKAGPAYTLHVTSEDKVTATYYLVVTAGS